MLSTMLVELLRLFMLPLTDDGVEVLTADTLPTNFVIMFYRLMLLLIWNP